MSTKASFRRSEFQVNKLIVPAVVLLAFWGLAIFAWAASGFIQPLVMFGYIGTSPGGGPGFVRPPS